MFSRIKFVFVVLFAVFAAACTSKGIEPEKVQQLEIKNLQVISSSQFSGGQPTQEQLDWLKRVGVKHIINLRTPKEQKFDEASVVKKLGLNYVSIPVAGKAAINELNAEKLAAAIEKVGNEPVFVHCASGNRVGALIAINAFKTNGGDIDAALVEGKKWGLTRLEKMVKIKLEQMKQEKVNSI